MDLLPRVAFVVGLPPDVARVRWDAYLAASGLSPDAAYERLLYGARDAVQVMQFEEPHGTIRPFVR